MVEEPAPLHSGCAPSTKRSTFPNHKVLPRWFCCGVRREKSAGSAIPPYQLSFQPIVLPVESVLGLLILPFNLQGLAGRIQVTEKD